MQFTAKSNSKCSWWSHIKQKMTKELSEMSLEELWKLFPIFLVEHKKEWTKYYDEMKAHLTVLLSDYPIERISHIGSTAINEIWAKNIVDVLIEIANNAKIIDIASCLEKNGFTVMSKAKERISLNFGYSKHGFEEKVYHIHLRYVGDNDELYFRDYLNEHPQVAKEYETLKLRLWKQYEHNRDAYTEAKTDFISNVTTKAKEKYMGRY